MKLFSDKIKYGIAAMFDLAKNYTKNLIKVKDIAESQHIPHKFLEQILNTLKKNGLIYSLRGSSGGYKLKKPPHKITVYDIIIALESNIDIIDETKQSMVLSSFWEEIESSLKENLKITLEDLLNKQISLDGKFSYQI